MVDTLKKYPHLLAVHLIFTTETGTKLFLGDFTSAIDKRWQKSN